MSKISIVIGSWGSYSVCNERALGSEWLNLEDFDNYEEIEQDLIKQYLQENVSETLANKINNGVKIVKDNKTLINKKDLIGFAKFANEEARKLAEKGSNCA